MAHDKSPTQSNEDDKHNDHSDKTVIPNSLHETVEETSGGPDNTSIASSESQQSDLHYSHQVKPLNPSESPIYPADSPYTAFPPHIHRKESRHSSRHEQEAPPNTILGPLGDLERSVSSLGDLERQQSQMTRQQSTVTSASKKSLKVPMKEKRGLLAQIVVVPEYRDARDYPQKIKYLIVTIIALASITGPMGTSIMLPAIDDIVDKLHTTNSEVNVSVGVYLLSLGIFPLWWSSFSERFGRRSVYLVSFVFFVAFSIGTALSPNISGLIVLRVLQGGSSASVQAVGAGTIADLFAPHERGKAMGWYYLGPLMGPFLAPILGGAVSQAWGWRATQWLLLIFAACNLISMTFFLPETLRKVDNLQAIKAMMQNSNDDTNEDDEKSNTSQSVDGDQNSCSDGSLNEQKRKQKEEGGEEEEEQPRGISDTELQRIATNLSRRSAAGSINSHFEGEDDDGPVVDPVMPTLSRLTTNRSTYSRRLHQNYISEEVRRSASNLPSEAASRVASSNSLADAPPHNKWASFKINSYDLFIRPLHSTILLKHPPVILVILFSGISFALIYFFNLSISYEYAKAPYNFSQIIVGLMYIPNSVTYFAASMIGGRWNDYLLNKYAEKHGELVPESRISWNIVLAVILYPISCFIFGWTIKYGEFWLVPLIGTAICGFASMLVIGATVTYLVDTLPGKGATGVALNNLIRQILAAIATFIVEPLLRAIGPGVLFSILAGILIVASLILVYLKRRGAYFREHYDLMLLYDKL
ncbi:hypothetical protein CANMA_002344 [Candida margitis]|uniref:uncharacterized protein n=1 Tax=Candida margitis TaxID=1775924 RepID=UPI002227679C|nr:uncharacterized protein CANMA_002344 [Candida margitis]KAI5968599.1 hypothetical protein CANMA_002344 [Candida margitis]